MLYVCSFNESLMAKLEQGHSKITAHPKMATFNSCKTLQLVFDSTINRKAIFLHHGCRTCNETFIHIITYRKLKTRAKPLC